MLTGCLVTVLLLVTCTLCASAPAAQQSGPSSSAAAKAPSFIMTRHSDVAPTNEDQQHGADGTMSTYDSSSNEGATSHNPAPLQAVTVTGQGAVHAAAWAVLVTPILAGDNQGLTALWAQKHLWTGSNQQGLGNGVDPPSREPLQGLGREAGVAIGEQHCANAFQSMGLHGYGICIMPNTHATVALHMTHGALHGRRCSRCTHA